MIAPDVTAWQIIYAVLRVRLFWPLYALFYLCVGMNLKMRWVGYRERKNSAEAARPEVVHQTWYPDLPLPPPERIIQKSRPLPALGTKSIATTSLPS